MNQSKCLLVYIHAWHHHDTKDFASQVLNSDHFERFTRSSLSVSIPDLTRTVARFTLSWGIFPCVVLGRFILWGADVHGADGLALSDACDSGVGFSHFVHWQRHVCLLGGRMTLGWRKGCGGTNPSLSYRRLSDQNCIRLEATRFPFLAVIVCHSNGEQVTSTAPCDILGPHCNCGW